MESYLPTRPNSDLHRRLSARKRRPVAMESSVRAPEMPVERNRPRSSSFSTIGQSLSRLLPSNRSERGGTTQAAHSRSRMVNNPSPAKGLTEILSIRGRINDQEDKGEERRRTKSWSPKKISRIAAGKDNEDRQPTVSKKPKTLNRSWELHKTVRVDDATDNLLQHTNPPHSNIQELHRAKHNRPVDNTILYPCSPRPASFVTADIQESVTALKRSQQIFEEKKSRRQERRSFRESEDFIGVQGINPRTGYPDPSTATSSSVEDGISESTRQRLEEYETIMTTASKEYKAALERREGEMKKLAIERETRRKEKRERAEKRRAQLRARVKRDGRWKIDGNTWSMVTEPSLSPIVQSITGTSIHETVTSSHQFLKTSVIANDKMMDKPGTRIEDYLHPSELSKTPTKYRRVHVDAALHTPPSRKEQIQDIKISPSRLQHSRMSISFDHLDSNIQGTPVHINQNFTLPIRRKEVGSAILRRRASSSETVIHNTEIAQPLLVELAENGDTIIPTTPLSERIRLEPTAPRENVPKHSSIPLVAGEVPFLEGTRASLISERQREDEAIVTLSQSAVRSQALTYLPSLQNLKGTFQKPLICSLEEIPPVVLKDPLSARILPNNQNPLDLSPSPISRFASRLTQQELGDQKQGTITPITITTGFVALPHPLRHINCFEDANEDQAKLLRQVLANSRTLTVKFHQKETLNGMPNSASLMSQADIATSSSQHRPMISILTKQPILTPCQLISLKLENRGPKSILISTSTSPQRQRLSRQHTTAQQHTTVQQHTTAQNTTPTAFVGATSHRLCKEVKERSSSLATSKVKTTEKSKEAVQGRKIFSAGNVDIGNLSKSLEEAGGIAQLLRIRVEQAKQLGVPLKNSGEDQFIVRYTEIENKPRISDENTNPGQKQALQTTSNKKFKGTQGPSSKKLKKAGKGVTKVSLLRKVYGMLTAAIGTAWYFVLPVFNPRSSLRRRWGRNELTWRDMLLIGAAGIFGGGAFLIMVLLARLLGVGLQIVRVCIKVCKVLVQL